MATETCSIHDVAAEFDRLFAGDDTLVDPTKVSWGLGTEAGHMGHEYADGTSVVGWFCDGGNAGNPVLSVRNEDLGRACGALRSLKAARSLRDIERALGEAGVRFGRLA